MKICVYAICKNEEKFVKRWVESMSEADYICVLDTGSTDKTVELLKSYNNVIVKQKVIKPWRFDSARNESMKLIPKDTNMCVCTDLDEIFEKGWRQKLEQSISSDTKNVQYRYTWNFNEDGSEGVVFYANKIHSYGDFYWKHPVHEVIVYNGKEPFKSVLIKDLQLNHYADNTKSRGQYLPLLELSVNEEPENDRNVHYLGREYYFNGQYEKAIETLKKHLNLKTATWKDERSSSMRYIAICYAKLNDLQNAELYYKLSIKETPKNREPYYELGKFYYNNERYLDAICVFESMLNIEDRQLNYISNPQAWGFEVFDYLSLCYYKLDDKKNALVNSIKAMNLRPNDERLNKNFEYFKKMI